MRYLLLVYEDERRGALPADERAALAQACRDSDAALRASGYLLAAEATEGAATAATVRARRGGVAVGAGPIAARPAQLRAVVVISARDLNEAIQVAAGMPQIRLGPIEVRPLREQGR